MRTEETVNKISEVTLACGDEQFLTLSEITDLYPYGEGFTMQEEVESSVVTLVKLLL